MTSFYNRVSSSIVAALPKAGKTIFWLLKIILPVSFMVTFLQYWGVIAQIATIMTPVFSFIGLPGESAIVFISSMFLPLYGPIAILSTLSLDMREITILALMCLISHNLVVETAIQKKTGSSAFIMFSLRIATSFFAAFLLNYLLPPQMGIAQVQSHLTTFTGIPELLLNWLQNSGSLILKITLIVSALMMLQNILKEFNLLQFFSKAFMPLMRIMGLSADSSFLWFVAQTLGLSYGSAVMIESVQNHEISKPNANVLNYHIAINHSLLEDTLLFVAIGVPAVWITLPRIILAIIAVWVVRLFIRIKNPSIAVQ